MQPPLKIIRSSSLRQKDSALNRTKTRPNCTFSDNFIKVDIDILYSGQNGRYRK